MPSWGGTAGEAPPDAMLRCDVGILFEGKFEIAVKKWKIRSDFALDSIDVVSKKCQRMFEEVYPTPRGSA